MKEARLMDKAAIIAHPSKQNSADLSERVLKVLRQEGMEVYAEKQLAEGIGAIPFDWEPEVAGKLKFCVVLGGDGTLLGAARQTMPYSLPLLGINLGHVGFLAEVHEGDIDEAIRMAARGHYSIDERAMLVAQLIRGGKVIDEIAGLNDVVISKGSLSRLITLGLYIGDESLGHFPGDGIIIATPTGSTAYSLSAGGPLVSPDLDVLVATFICPHVLFSRSIVVKGDGRLRVIVESCNEDAMLAVDGQVFKRLEAGDELRAKKSVYTTLFIRLRERNFYGILKERLKEGRL